MFFVLTRFNAFPFWFFFVFVLTVLIWDLGDLSFSRADVAVFHYRRLAEDRFIAVSLENLSRTLSDDLSQVSRKLASLAKENGSTDNITIIVTFLRPVQEICARHDNELDAGNNVPDADSAALYSGITSTSSLIGPFNNNKNTMNGTEFENQQMEEGNANGTDDALPSPDKPVFDSPSGSGGEIFGDSPNPFTSAAENSISGCFEGDDSENIGNLGEFKQASPSMFEQMTSPVETEGVRSTAYRELEEIDQQNKPDEVDFMARQDQHWITQPISNPFGNEGVKVGASHGSSSAVVASVPEDNNFEENSHYQDEEEVATLLAKVSDGQLKPQDVMEFARKGSSSPSSDEEEEGKYFS